MDSAKRYVGLNLGILRFTSNVVERNLSFWAQSTECFGCPLMSFGQTTHKKLSTNTTFPTKVTLMDQEKNICSNYHTYVEFKFGENGEYEMDVDKGNVCSISVTKQPDNIYLPLLWAFLVYFIVIIAWVVGKWLIRHFYNRNDSERLIISDLGSPEDDSVNPRHLSTSVDLIPQLNTSKKRLKSLDAFRGFSMTVMIFVEYGGGEYWFFAHSDWNGLTVADLVFPWFMWIMGVSMVLSLHSMLRNAVPKRKIFEKIIYRSCLLFLIGLIINCRKGYTFQDMRILGVLQRFAICYLIVGCADILFTRINDVRLHVSVAAQPSWLSYIRDVLICWPQWIIALSFVLIHTCITFLLHVPGCPTGYLGPGGLSDNVKYGSCTGGAARYIDEVVLGKSHMYQHPTCAVIYDTNIPYDPEGILGILTATFLVFLGLQAGRILVFHYDHKQRITRWLIWAVITGAIGAILCNASKNDGWINVNKNLWSLSFVLVLGSMAFVLLSIFYILIDVLQWWSGAPFFYAGMNSILLYIGHAFTKEVFPWGWTCQKTDGHICYLFNALWGTTLWVLISIYLYHKKFFLIL